MLLNEINRYGFDTGNPDYWYVEGVGMVQDILSEFSAHDWNALTLLSEERPSGWNLWLRDYISRNRGRGIKNRQFLYSRF